jgi:hypothetical protein
MARVCALDGKWDEGRAEFAAADALAQAGGRDYSVFVRRAMFEYKAGQTESGDRLVAQTKGLLVEPAPLYLALLMESIRFKMPKPRSDEYAKLWDAEMKKKRRSETAGELAGLMGSFLSAGVDYTGRAGHIKKILTYLRKTTTLKYRREDIENVVAFLAELAPGERPLFQKLVKAGVKQHPDSVLLQMTAGGLEMMETGMHTLFGGRIPASAREHLETALRLAEASTDPKIAALLPGIRERLGMLDEVQNATDHFGFPFGGPPFGPEDDYYDMFDDEFDDDDEFDEDDEDEDRPFRLDFGPPPRRGRRSGSKKPKGRGRKKR